MQGHVLHIDQNAPAQNAPQYVVVSAKKYRGRCGHHTNNFLDTLQADIKLGNKNLRNTILFINY